MWRPNVINLLALAIVKSILIESSEGRTTTTFTDFKGEKAVKIKRDWDYGESTSTIAPGDYEKIGKKSDKDGESTSLDVSFDTTSTTPPTMSPSNSTTILPTDFTPTSSPTYNPKNHSIFEYSSTSRPTLSPTINPTLQTIQPTNISHAPSQGSSELFQANTSITEASCVTGTDLSAEFDDCLSPRDSSGCGNKSCESIICKDLNDKFCCDSVWDSVCASEAEIYCVLEQLPKSDCFAYSAEGGCDNNLCMEEICLFDEHCCNQNWDFDCIIHSVKYCCTSYFI